jgi:hypothetical protein
VPARVKYSKIIADNLSKAGWSWGCVSAIDSNGRTIFAAEMEKLAAPLLRQSNNVTHTTTRLRQRRKPNVIKVF